MSGSATKARGYVLEKKVIFYNSKMSGIVLCLLEIVIFRVCQERPSCREKKWEKNADQSAKILSEEVNAEKKRG